MTTLHTARLTTDAVVAVLDANLPANILVGDGEAPIGAGWQGTPGQSSFHGYVVVYPIFTSPGEGSMLYPESDTDAEYQVSTVGATRQQCEFVADLSRIIILGTPVAVSGRGVMRVLAVPGSAGALREDTGQPQLWVSRERYRLRTTPA